jgi:alpha-L-fucosidase
MTIGNQWAWKPGDEIKSKKECVHTLISTLGGDGNLLFNVGPMPDGRIEPRQVERLKEMGQWVSAHQEAIYGTRGGPFLPSKKLASTYKGKRIYLYLLEPTGKKLDLPLPDDFKILKVSFLENGQSVKFKQDPEGARIFLPDLLPDETASVLVLDLNRPASDIEPTKL